MKKSKKVFAGFAAAFVALILYVSYDFATKTTFPQRRKPENSGGELQKNDSTNADSTVFFDKK